ncbi:hypothetical protein A3J41_00460 [candidate division TM6 bacterium RIFCSPHIGHO2_12_FULL_38_8]|nr:MAG: hypothetical protein A3J41_00460 [candidate division TM6 bacterium RIFCSPHIGHO2_12_FULL_38_8]
MSKRPLWSLLFFSLSMYSFDVKVLLFKKPICDLEKNKIELFSQNGFIVSSHQALALGCEYPGKTITISGKHESIWLQDKPLQEKLVHLYPNLSPEQLKQLQSLVTDWFEGDDFYQNEESMLYPIFDALVSSQQNISEHYQQINVYALKIFQLFLQDCIDAIEEPLSVTIETLQSYADEFLNNRAKFLFLEKLAALNLTKDDRKKLEKDKRYRYVFFLDHLHGIIKKLLSEFLPVLPVKFLQQVLKKDAVTIEFENNKYLGSFLLFQDKKQLYVINSLDIDDYLLSVVKNEGWPGWPLEMNKVLAIACRTYLIWQVLRAQKMNRPYHIENGIKHQTYKGHHQQVAKFKQAVQETKDMFVSYNDKPALTMYDACCGGIVPANIDDPDHKRVSYLARSYPCTFCKNFKLFHWRVDLSSEAIVKRLQKDFPKVLKIVDMIVQKRDKAGLVTKILINVGSRKIMITEKKMKSLFPELKSSCFTITRAHRHYLIEGKGLGHHRGLCQWGACKLIKDEHWGFGQVLQFYYPGTKLMKLTYQR